MIWDWASMYSVQISCCISTDIPGGTSSLNTWSFSSFMALMTAKSMYGSLSARQTKVALPGME